MSDRQAEALEALDRVETMLIDFGAMADFPDDRLDDLRTIRVVLENYQRIIKSYENLAFRFGAMLDPPCFRCGYEGEGYFQSDRHPCAERHHELYRWRKSQASR